MAKILMFLSLSVPVDAKDCLIISIRLSFNMVFICNIGVKYKSLYASRAVCTYVHVIRK